VTALEIQALKRVKKNSKVLLLDKSGGGPAKNVAKELSKLGFRSVFIVTGGFSGWTASKLQIKQVSTPLAPS
jgi:3-mercaptopyruvate sulfurtransferase SseA